LPGSSPSAAITRTQAEKARRFEIQPNCGRDAICGTATLIAMAIRVNNRPEWMGAAWMPRLADLSCDCAPKFAISRRADPLAPDDFRRSVSGVDKFPQGLVVRPLEARRRIQDYLLVVRELTSSKMRWAATAMVALTTLSQGASTAVSAAPISVLMTSEDRWVAPRRAVGRLRGRLVADLRRYAIVAEKEGTDLRIKAHAWNVNQPAQ
jgi:hypothetical protein